MGGVLPEIRFGYRKKGFLMRHRVRRFATSAAILSALAGWPALTLQAQQPPAAAVPSEARAAPLDELAPLDPAVTVGELLNGLRYYIRENHEPENRALLRLIVRVGSVVEDGDQLGLAHVLEHMAFNGTENFEKQELLEFMESIGMRLGQGVNAATGFDQTSYRLEVPTDDPELLSTAFQILEDWAHGLTLDPVEIDQERGVVVEEWRMRRGVQARLMDAQLPVVLEGSQYAERLPIGTVESIETFEYEALSRFYRDWYRPDLMAVVAVGDFDRAEVENLLVEHFEGVSGPENPRPRPDYTVPQHDETLFSVLTDPELSSTRVAIHYKMDLERDATVGGYRQRIVEGMYNRMLNERFREIALDPDAPFLSASSAQGQYVGPLGVYSLRASVLEGQVEAGMSALLREAERVSRFGFTEGELERERIAELRGIEQAYTNLEDRGSNSYVAEYSRAFTEGESIPGIEYEYELYQRFIPGITLEEVNEVGRGWIRDTNQVVVVEGPERDGLALPAEAELASILSSAGEEDITAYVDSLSDAELLSDPPEGSRIAGERELERELTEWTLANGVRVILKSTDYDEDRVLFRGFSPGGTSLAGDEDLISASTAVELVSGGGLGDFNSIDLGRVLTGKVASVSPFISEFEEGVSGSASLSDLEAMFQLIYLTFTAPREDEDFAEVWMTQARQALANRDANPVTAWSDTYRRLMTRDHPRTRPMTVDRLDEVDLRESLEFYEDRFADASDFTFVFVGALDVGVLRPLVERYLGGLPSIGRTEIWRDVGVRAPDGVLQETVYRGLEPQSQTVITFNGPFEYGNQSERSAIRALGLAVESQLMEEVREELGGTYGIFVGPSYAWRPAESYQLTVSFGSDPDRAEELAAVVLGGIERFKESGPTEDQAAAARETLLRQFETDFQENGTWLGQLVSDFQRGVEPGAAVETFEASVEALSVETLRDAARRYFDMDNYVRVTLMPE